jgi:hypothetical protein
VYPAVFTPLLRPIPRTVCITAQQPWGFFEKEAVRKHINFPSAIPYYHKAELIVNLSIGILQFIAKV